MTTVDTMRTQPAAVIRPDAYLPSELVALLGCIERRESPESIAQRCEQIAKIYRERPSPNELWDQHRWAMVRLLDQAAAQYRAMPAWAPSTRTRLDA